MGFSFQGTQMATNCMNSPPAPAPRHHRHMACPSTNEKGPSKRGRWELEALLGHERPNKGGGHTDDDANQCQFEAQRLSVQTGHECARRWKATKTTLYMKSRISLATHPAMFAPAMMIWTNLSIGAAPRERLAGLRRVPGKWATHRIGGESGQLAGLAFDQTTELLSRV